MTRKQAERLLAVLILARSTGFLMSKTALAEIDTFSLLALRFLLGFLCLTPVLWRRRAYLNRKSAARGALMGGTLFFLMSAEATALHTAPTSTVSFLENTAIVLVPLTAATLRRQRPERRVLCSALTALAGVGFLTLGGGSAPLAGKGFGLLAAVFYTVTILLTDRFSRDSDPLVLGILQAGTLGVLALVSAVLFETPVIPQSTRGWGAVLYLAVVCTAFGFVLQPMAQRHTTADRAGLLCALSPLNAALLGRVVLGERLGIPGILGAVLIFLGILAVKLAPAEEPALRPGSGQI